MDLRAVGAAGANTDPSVRPAEIPQPGTGTSQSLARAGLAPDTIATLLGQLAASRVSDLILHLEASRSAIEPATVDALFRAAGEAAAGGDLPRALARVGDIVSLNPELAERARTEPVLEPVRGVVNNFLQDLVRTARLHAVERVEAASTAIGVAVLSRRDRLDADLVLSLANRLLDAGRHIDLVRADELAGAILLQFPGALPPAREAPAEARTSPPAALGPDGTLAILRAARQLRRKLREWWGRVPVLVLLGAWIGLGGMALVLRPLWPDSWTLSIAVEAWAAGILAFIVYIRIRSVRL